MAGVTSAGPQIDGEAEHSAIDGDIRPVEDREVDRFERQKIDHITQAPAIETVAQGPAKERR